MWLNGFNCWNKAGERSKILSKLFPYESLDTLEYHLCVLYLGLPFTEIYIIDLLHYYSIFHHYIHKTQLDLESIGSSLGIDWKLIWSGVVRLGLDNRNLIIESNRGLRRW